MKSDERLQYRVKVKEKIQYLVPCLIEGCEGEMDITHIAEEVLSTRASKLIGPWYCKECGRGLNWVILISSGRISAIGEVSGKKSVKRLILLDSNFSDKPIQVIVRDNYGASFEDSVDQLSRDLYYYNKGTCPTNYLQNIEFILEGGDRDPHGIFQFNSAVEVDDDFKEAVCELGRCSGVLSSQDSDDWDHAFNNIPACQIRLLFERFGVSSEDD